MKPLYVTVLSSMQVAIAFVTICAAFVILLWVVPAIRREVDRKAGGVWPESELWRRLVTHSFAREEGFIDLNYTKSVWSFVFLGRSLFGYEKITIVHTVKTIRGRLVISIAGVRVWIIGGERKIEEFGRILSDRIASAKKRCSLQSAVASG